MARTSPKEYFLMVLPVLLIASTAHAFVSMSLWLGKDWGYQIGFLFYILVWCLGVPLAYLGLDGLRSLFAEETPLFRRQNWLLIVLLGLITFGAIGLYLPAFSCAADVAQDHRDSCRDHQRHERRNPLARSIHQGISTSRHPRIDLSSDWISAVALVTLTRFSFSHRHHSFCGFDVLSRIGLWPHRLQNKFHQMDSPLA
jgi:hypothetical protein